MYYSFQHILYILAIDVNKTIEFLQVKKPQTPQEEAKQLLGLCFYMFLFYHFVVLLLDLEAKILTKLEQAQIKVKLATDAKYKTIESIMLHSQTLKRAVDDGVRGNWTVVNEALEKSEELSKKDVVDECTSRNAIDALRKVFLNIYYFI